MGEGASGYQKGWVRHMAKILNGNAPGYGTEDARSQEVTDHFQKEVWDLWAKFQRNEDILNPTQFYQTTTLALMHMAAVVAVDCGITDMQLVGMAKKLWDDVHAKAPRFS